MSWQNGIVSVMILEKGIFVMTATVSDYLGLLLEKYEKRMGVSRFKSVIELGRPFARYYSYRFKYGNPTGKTLDKIHCAICTQYPEIIIETILEILIAEYPIILIDKIAEYLTEEQIEILVEKRKIHGKQHTMAISDRP